MNEQGELRMEVYSELLSSKTRLVFVNHVSNALGTINPIETIIQKAHQVGAAVLVDGAQACAHMKPNLKLLDVDFYVTSAHKMCVPRVWECSMVKRVVGKLPPFQGGGEMIKEVTFEKNYSCRVAS